MGTATEAWLVGLPTERELGEMLDIDPEDIDALPVEGCEALPDDTEAADMEEPDCCVTKEDDTTEDPDVVAEFRRPELSWVAKYPDDVVDVL